MCQRMRHLIDVERLVSGFMTLFYGAKLVSDTLRLTDGVQMGKQRRQSERGRGGGGRTEGDREVLQKEAERKDEKNFKSNVHLVLKILML